MTKGASSFSIKNWSDEDKPREKLAQKGRSALSNAELIAILLLTGTKGKSVIELAQILLKENNLSQLATFSLEAFTKQSGIGRDKAATLIADIAPTYFVAISALVAAFFGADALRK